MGYPEPLLPLLVYTYVELGGNRDGHLISYVPANSVLNLVASWLYLPMARSD